MRRKTSILVSLILLLSIGGGAVAFYLHLQKQTPPPFSEVDAFLRQFPTPPYWPEMTMNGVIAVSGGSPWLEKIGVRRTTEVFTTCYCIVIHPSGNRVSVDVAQDSQRISGVWIHADPKDRENLKRLLLEKFPTLRGSLRNDNIP